MSIRLSELILRTAKNSTISIAVFGFMLSVGAMGLYTELKNSGEYQIQAIERTALIAEDMESRINAQLELLSIRIDRIELEVFKRTYGVGTSSAHSQDEIQDLQKKIEELSEIVLQMKKVESKP